MSYTLEERKLIGELVRLAKYEKLERLEQQEKEDRRALARDRDDVLKTLNGVEYAECAYRNCTEKFVRWRFKRYCSDQCRKNERTYRRKTQEEATWRQDYLNNPPPVLVLGYTDEPCRECGAPVPIYQLQQGSQKKKIYCSYRCNKRRQGRIYKRKQRAKAKARSNSA